MRKLLPVVALLLLVPLVGAQTWSFQDAFVEPDPGSNGTEGVVAVNVTDEDGDPVSPDHCSSVNIVYDYETGQNDVRMVYAGIPGWYYNDTLVYNQSDSDLSITISGTCDGTQTGSGNTQSVGFTPAGNISVDLLTDVSRRFIAEETVPVEWNATNHTGGFENRSNLTYRVRTFGGDVLRRGNVSGGGVTVGDDRFSAEVQMPFERGRYVLVADARNDSLPYLAPWGGTAAVLDVDPRLRGETLLRPANDRCRMDGGLRCEKGGSVNVLFHEEYGTATEVNATITGGQNNYTELELQRYNDTYWNRSFHIDRDINTTRYGFGLTARVNATDGNVTVQPEASLALENFTILEATQPFVVRGSTIDLVAGPVFPFSELPVPVNNVSTAEITVRNTTGGIVKALDLEAPFTGDVYDGGKQLFEVPYSVPRDADTGDYEVYFEVEDVFNVSVNTTYTFRVLKEGSAETSIVLAGVDGEVGRDRLNETVGAPGEHRFTVLLNNTADSPALVDVYFTGDLSGRSEVDADQPISFSANQLRNPGLNFTLDEKRSYLGTVKFHVHGSEVSEYNLTMDANLTVTSSCSEQNGSICVLDSRMNRQIDTAGDYALAVDVRNTGPEEVTWSVTHSGNITDLLSSDTVTVGSGQRQRIHLNFTADFGDAGVYTGTTTITNGSRSVDLPARIRVNTSTGAISATATPSALGSFVDGDPVDVTLEITNTGNVPVESLRTQAPEVGIIEEENVTIQPGDNITRTYSGTAAQTNGQATITVELTTDRGARAEAEFTYKGFRDYGQAFDDLQDDIDGLRTDLANRTGNKTEAENALDSAARLIDEGEQAWADGDYSEAQSKYTEAVENREAADQAIADLGTGGGDDDGGGGGGLPIVPILVVLIILAVVGAVLYLSIVPEEEETQSGFGYR